MGGNKVKCAITLFMILATAFCFGETLTVGKGGQYKNIGDAIAAAANGDAIVIKSGNYSQSGSLYIEGKNGLEIRGEGKVNIACSQYLPVFYITNCKNITIRNIHGFHSIKDPSVGKGMCGPGATIISAEQSTGITVLNCELNGCGQTGFESWSCDSIVLSGNYIHDNVNSAVAIYIPYLKTTPDIRIENNRIENNFGPIIIETKEGLLNMYYRDMTGLPGTVMNKNKWKNNNLMPKVVESANGQTIGFCGTPNIYDDDSGKKVLYSGILYADTTLLVRDWEIMFLNGSYIYFYGNGSVQEGIAAEKVSLTVDDVDYTVPITGKMQFYESGALKSAEVEDGSVLKFDEEGVLVE
jgi:parallel beta-helix repeat protein